MAFAVEVVNEPFTASNQTLAAYLASAHASWVFIVATSGTDRLNIVSNQVDQVASGNTAIRVSETHDADHWVEVAAVAASTGAIINLFLRASADTDGARDCVCVEIVENGAGTYAHGFVVQNGSATGDVYSGALGTMAGHSFAADVEGRTVKVYVDRALVHTFTDLVPSGVLTTGNPAWGTSAFTGTLTVDSLKTGNVNSGGGGTFFNPLSGRGGAAAQPLAA